MADKIDTNKVYIPSDEIVAREIEGEVIIVPLTSGVANMEDELYSLNETGKEIWARLDGKRSIEAIIDGLKEEYEEEAGEIEKDVVGLLQELFTRKMIVEKPA